jgi:glutamyl-tRNA synthetase
MKMVTEAVDAMREFDTAAIEEVLRAQCEATGLPARDLFMMVRVAVTGRTATPPLFGSMEVIGKARCQNRLRRAAQVLRP